MVLPAPSGTEPSLVALLRTYPKSRFKRFRNHDKKQQLLGKKFAGRAFLWLE